MAIGVTTYDRTTWADMVSRDGIELPTLRLFSRVRHIRFRTARFV
jgi:hypothetical protein